MEAASKAQNRAERKTPSWVKIILVVALAISIIVLVTEQDIELPSDQREALAPASEVGIKVGMFAPDFTLRDLQGNDVKLSDFRGQTVMMNFWATWCPPCREEMPTLQSAYHEQGGKGFVVLAVSLDDDPSEVERFIKDFGLTFPVVIDAQKQVSFQYRIRPIPTTYLIDKDGVIRDIQVGPMDRKILLKKLSKVM
jgi:peroxiredoxin